MRSLRRQMVGHAAALVAAFSSPFSTVGWFGLAPIATAVLFSAHPALAGKSEAQLLTLLDSPDAGKVANAMEGLEENYPTEEAKAKIASMVTDPRVKVRRKAARVLGALHVRLDVGTVDSIALMLAEQEKDTVLDALKALHDLRASSTVPKILPLLTSPDANIKRDACRTLADIADKSAIPKIEPLLSDSSGKVVKDARLAIEKLKDREPTASNADAAGFQAGSDPKAPPAASRSSRAPALSSGCKPDVSRVDKITKQQQDIWVQRVAATGFGASLMGSTDVAISITVGRYGAFNALNVEILKEEASKASASFDSSLRAAKGGQFLLGFKNGQPLSLTASDVGNETKVRDDVLDFGRGKVVTTVVLSSAFSDETAATMREALTTRPIDAIRVNFVGGV